MQLDRDFSWFQSLTIFANGILSLQEIDLESNFGFWSCWYCFNLYIDCWKGDGGVVVDAVRGAFNLAQSIGLRMYS